MYSSTATTVVLSKKALSVCASEEILNILNASIIIATSMMYLRLLAIAFIFNIKIAKNLIIPMTLFAVVGVLILFILYKKNKPVKDAPINDKNPLELGAAFIFAFLFIAMMILTKFVITHYGNEGLKILSFLIGFTDIDPFVLSLLTGKFQINTELISSAIIIAAGSNNILKAIYAVIFSKQNTKKAGFLLFILGIFTIAYGIFIF